MKTYALSINRCPEHRSFWSISLDEGDGGLRLTPSKCCGRWTEQSSWPQSAEDLRRIVGELEHAIAEIERTETPTDD